MSDEIFGKVFIYTGAQPMEPIVSIEALDDSAMENASGEDPDPAVFRVSRAGGDQSQALTVQLSTDGTATLGTDYDLPTSVTIPAGASFADVTLNVIDDDEAEGIEPGTVHVQPDTINNVPAYSVSASEDHVGFHIADNVRISKIDVRAQNVENGASEYSVPYSIVLIGEGLDRVAATLNLTWQITSWDYANQKNQAGPFQVQGLMAFDILLPDGGGAAINASDTWACDGKQWPGVAPNGKVFYTCYETTIDAAYRYTFRDMSKAGTPIIDMIQFGWTWTNMNSLANFPQYNILVCATDYFAPIGSDAPGTFWDVYGIAGV
jgi:hypothetical protein